MAERTQQMSETVTLTFADANGSAISERAIPRRLGPIVLRHEIGRGAMGVVFRGRHDFLDRDVAVKLLLHVVGGEDDLQFDRFRAEARMAAAVRHPCLTMIHHADVANGIPYLVMDYIDGPTLATVMKQSGALSVNAALAVALAIGDAVATLHRNNIVHRDIKPRNTLLDPAGQVFVTDFGLALTRTQPRESVTPSGIAGTPTYMAPEMFEGLVSPRSDVYALGITVFELITGSPPFLGSLLDLRKQHAGAELPIPALEALGVTTAIIDVLQRATRKNATYRYKTAAHFYQSLEAATDESQRTTGCAKLRALAASFAAREAPPAADPPASGTPETTYFEQLGKLVDQKRERSVEEPALDRTQRVRADRSSYGSISAATTDESHDRDVALAISCVRCGYNLCGLDAVTQCPECGAPVSFSDRPPRLMFAEPRWLTRVHRGLTMILTTVAVFVAAYPLVFLNASVFFLAVILVLIPACVAGMVGLFLATARDPSMRETRRLTVWRYAARVGGCIALGGVAAQLVQWIEETLNSRSISFSLETPSDVRAVLWLTVLAGLFSWLEHLALRNHDRARSKGARIAIAACAGPVFVQLLLAIVLSCLFILVYEAPFSVQFGPSFGGTLLLLYVLPWLYAGFVIASFWRLIKRERRLALALRASMAETGATALRANGTSREPTVERVSE